MEFGYAFRDQRNILIITKNEHTLPFLARGLAEVNDNVRTIYYKNDFDNCLRALHAHHEALLVR
ncbi:MAG: hypothetical protein ACOC4B_01790 [Bacteroidota bacterium]